MRSIGVVLYILGFVALIVGIVWFQTWLLMWAINLVLGLFHSTVVVTFWQTFAINVVLGAIAGIARLFLGK